MMVEDKLLFLKYALPCASTLVRRGVVSQDYVDNLIRLVSEGKVPEKGAESMFKVANAVCEYIARDMGKSTIDAKVIRSYFLLNHSKVVDERFETMKDFNPTDCKTYSGIVTEVNGDSAVVETVLGRKRYRTDFCSDVKKDDRVAVHFDFIVEKISAELSKRMNEARVAYEERN
jgi:hypothetical protein